MMMMLELEMRFKKHSKKSLRVVSTELGIQVLPIRMFCQKIENIPVKDVFAATTASRKISSATGLGTDYLSKIEQLFWIPGENFLL